LPTKSSRSGSRIVYAAGAVLWRPTDSSNPGLEIAVIQAFAARIVRLLKERDPLSERVHLSPLELLGQSLGAVAGEIGRRVFLPRASKADMLQEADDQPSN
jgi:hypothetical protein